MKFLQSVWFPVLLFAIVVIAVIKEINEQPAVAFKPIEIAITDTSWQAPSLSTLGNDSSSILILYGRDLISNTAHYLGPRGTINAITNGMNCQNCHLDAGIKPYGNCFSAVASIYPVFRPRSGKIESIEFRINDCLERSLNGKSIDSNSREMRAMVAYLKWLGKDVPRGKKPPGSGLQELTVMERSADTLKGKLVYARECGRCHGTNGDGQPDIDGIGYTYPPLWGSHSYNAGAGLYRISRLAAYVKDNMPFGLATHQNQQLSNEEAWDVAAYINSQPRPTKMFAQDWPDISKKAFDYPYGPYKDGYTETQHKYGPFGPIKLSQQQVTAVNKK